MSMLFNVMLLFPLQIRCAISSSSTFTLEDSAICLISEQSTMDVDRDDESVLDAYFVSLCKLESVIYYKLFIVLCYLL